MYLPDDFAETRTELLHGVIRSRPLGALVVPTAQGLEVNHLPFLVETDAAPFGRLVGHVARANPVWQTASAGEAVAIFQGPEGYITPSWYATKRETGKVVPTWNYVVVHAHGPLRFIDDVAWLHAHLQQLTERHEAPRPAPWKVTDAPEDFIDRLVGQIVGVELTVSRLLGKWKLSQNRSHADRQGVVDGLTDQGSDDARALAALVRAADDEDTLA